MCDIQASSDGHLGGRVATSQSSGVAGVGFVMAREDRILVVEDDERVRSALVNLLESWSYRVEAAADGNEGREKIDTYNPVVVLSDLKMPGLSGLELLKETRALDWQIHFI